MADASRFPDDFQSITPQLVVDGASAAIDFYTRAFGADELLRNASPDGAKIMHAELLLGNSRFLVHDEFPERDVVGPSKTRGTSVTLHLYVPDVDAVFARALAAGATEQMPVQDMFWGDRYGILLDPFGHRWSIATKKDDPSPADLQKRADDWAKQQQ